MSLHVVILAAGKGTRMASALPKVLHPLAGKPMLQHVVETATQLSPEKIHVIVGHESERVKSTLDSLPVNWIYQAEQLGTGHAVRLALPELDNAQQVLVLYGDVPLINVQTLQQLVSEPQQLRLLTAELANPTGLGRILRDPQQHITGIIEEKDANPQQRLINEIFTGILSTPAHALQQWLPQLSNDNAQAEYYLTDIVSMALHDGTAVSALTTRNVMEIQGVNDRWQLSVLERLFQQQQVEALAKTGVSFADPARVDIRGDLHCGQDVSIDANVIFSGNVALGNNVSIGANCVLHNVSIADNTTVHPFCHLDNCTLGDNTTVGPYARLRPGAVLRSGAKVGNFVEVKKAIIGKNSKVNHLSYIGDATLGENVNVGAGTITCNYDGVNKHQTIIEDGAFIGSDTQLVAPVTIGKNATIGAGSTVRKDAPAEQLTLNDSKQKTIPAWRRPQPRDKK